MDRATFDKKFKQMVALMAELAEENRPDLAARWREEYLQEPEPEQKKQTQEQDM